MLIQYVIGVKGFIYMWYFKLWIVWKNEFAMHVVWILSLLWALLLSIMNNILGESCVEKRSKKIINNTMMEISGTSCEVPLQTWNCGIFLRALCKNGNSSALAMDLGQPCTKPSISMGCLLVVLQCSSCLVISVSPLLMLHWPDHTRHLDPWVLLCINGCFSVTKSYLPTAADGLVPCSTLTSAPLGFLAAICTVMQRF